MDIFLSSDCTSATACSDPRLVCIKGGSCVAETMVATLRPFPGAGNDAGVDTGGTIDSGPGADRPGTDAGRDTGGPVLGAWKLVSSPNVPAGATLNKVWPLAANDVWVVGAMGTRGVAYHYDGSAWTAVPPPTTVPALYGVWSGAADDAWAVGTGGTIVHHTAVGAWTLSISASTSNLSGLWGFSATDIT